MKILLHFGAARFRRLPATRPQIIIIICAVAWLVFLQPGAALAQEPTPTPNFDMPYDFEPVDVDSGDPNPVSVGLGDMLANVDFINSFGSVSATVWTILDNFAGGGVLGYFVIFLLGLVVIKWAAGFVYGKPIKQDKELDRDIKEQEPKRSRISRGSKVRF